MYCYNTYHSIIIYIYVLYIQWPRFVLTRLTKDKAQYSCQDLSRSVYIILYYIIYIYIYIIYLILYRYLIYDISYAYIYYMYVPVCCPISTSDMMIWPAFESKWWTKITLLVHPDCVRVSLRLVSQLSHEWIWGVISLRGKWLLTHGKRIQK